MQTKEKNKQSGSWLLILGWKKQFYLLFLDNIFEWVAIIDFYPYNVGSNVNVNSCVYVECRKRQLKLLQTFFFCSKVYHQYASAKISMSIFFILSHFTCANLVFIQWIFFWNGKDFFLYKMWTIQIYHLRLKFEKKIPSDSWTDIMKNSHHVLRIPSHLAKLPIIIKETHTKCIRTKFELFQFRM